MLMTYSGRLQMRQLGVEYLGLLNLRLHVKTQKSRLIQHVIPTCLSRMAFCKSDMVDEKESSKQHLDQVDLRKKK